MFNNLKNKLKFKMIRWLEFDLFRQQYNEYTKENARDKIYLQNMMIDKYEKIHKEMEINNNYYKSQYQDILKNYNEQSDKLDALNRTLQSIVSIGTDVVRPTPYDRNSSWAVVCIEGRYNIVKFIDLRGQDYRHMLDFLKQFECSRRVIDAPDFRFFEEAFVWEKEK